MTLLRLSPATALLACLGMPLLAGCGSSGGSGIPITSATPTPTGTSAGVYAQKSFVAANIPLATGQTGTLVVAVGKDAATIAGTLTIAISAVAEHRQASSGATIYSVPLTGSFTPGTGGFSLKGILLRGTASFNVTATGTLSTTGTTGGSTTITINNTSYTATFASAAANTGALSAAYFPLSPNTNDVYTETSSSNGGAPSTDTLDGWSFLGGYGTAVGATTQAQLNGVTVQKLAELDDTGTVSSYDYYTESSSGISVYRIENVDSAGAVTSHSDFSPPFNIGLYLTAGQSQTQTFTETDTLETTSPGSVTSPSSVTFTVNLTLNDFEPITVPGGTFQAAKFTVVNSSSSPATTTSGGFTSTSTDIIYLAPTVGVVQEHESSTYVRNAFGSTAASTTTSTDDYVLTSTTGAGRSAKVRSATVGAGRSAAGILGLLRANRP